MITPFELNNFLPLRETPGQTDGRHGRFRAGVAQADFLDAGHGLTDEPGEGDFQRVGNPEAGSVLGGLLHRPDNCWMRVSEDGWAPGADVIDQFVSIDIPDAGAFGPLHEKRLPPNGTESAH